MNTARRLLMTGAILAGVAGLLACDDLAQEPDPPFDPDSAGQTIGGTQITWSKNGQRSAVIHARMLTRLSGGDEVTLRDSVQVDLYDDDGTLAAIVNGDMGVINDARKTARVDSGITVRFLGSDEYGASTLRAEMARADDRTKEVYASGNVRVESDSGAHLSTERLIWEGRRRRFRAPGFVRITNGTEVEEGTELVANADLTEYTMQSIRGQVTRTMDEIREVRDERSGSEADAFPADADSTAADSTGGS